MQGKKTFLSTLNVMILQTVRNECVRFGRHVDMSYLTNYRQKKSINNIQDLGLSAASQGYHAHDNEWTDGRTDDGPWVGRDLDAL
jgi:hypothetical protein